MTADCPSSRESDNKPWWGCPPKMSDGRLYTDYRPRCDIQLENMQPMSSSLQHREFLIHNADHLISKHRMDAFDRTSCGPCVEPYYDGTMLHETDVVRCDKVACARIANDKPFGLGSGRDYGMLPEQREARDAFIAVMQNRQTPVSEGCAQSMNAGGYFPLSGLNLSAQQQDARWAVPGGGRPLPL